MIPHHCSEVSMVEAPFELTRSKILKELLGRKVYHKTNWLVLRHGKGKTGQHALVQIQGHGYGMFKNIDKAQIISLPKETAFVRAPKADPFNHNSMSDVLERTGKRAAVVEAMFDHITFVTKEAPVVIHLLDVIPPKPSKLEVMASKALMSMSLDHPVKLVYEIVDLTKLVKTKEVVYPCRARNMGKHKHAKFLHEVPKLHEQVTLVGCDISRRIFYSEYKRMPGFVNMCPKNFVKNTKGLKLIRCCLVEDKAQLEGDMVMVPWGVRMEDLRDAFNKLLTLAHKGRIAKTTSI
jgi:hypothetical protein